MKLERCCSGNISVKECYARYKQGAPCVRVRFSKTDPARFETPEGRRELKAGIAELQKIYRCQKDYHCRRKSNERRLGVRAWMNRRCVVLAPRNILKMICEDSLDHSLKIGKKEYFRRFLSLLRRRYPLTLFSLKGEYVRHAYSERSYVPGRRGTFFDDTWNKVSEKFRVWTEIDISRTYFAKEKRGSWEAMIDVQEIVRSWGEDEAVDSYYKILTGTASNIEDKDELVLRALLCALSDIARKKPAALAAVNIELPSRFLAGVLEKKLKVWAANDFVFHGQPIKNAKLWRKIFEILRGRKLLIEWKITRDKLKLEKNLKKNKK